MKTFVPALPGRLTTKNAKQAVSDLTLALEWLTDDRARKAAEQGLQSLRGSKQ